MRGSKSLSIRPVVNDIDLSFNFVSLGSADPLSSATWIQAASDSDWYKLKSVNGTGCYGKQPGGNQGSGGAPYDDSTALLRNPNVGEGFPSKYQEVITTFFITDQDVADYRELEHRLISNIATGINTGYEVVWRAANSSGSPYHNIVQWNFLTGSGTGNFVILADYNDINAINPPGIATNYQGRSVYNNGVITTYQRATSGDSWTQLLSYDTSSDVVKYRQGHCGLGHWLRGASGVGSHYGFKDARLMARLAA